MSGLGLFLLLLLQAAAAPASVDGTVIDSQTQRPLAGATVILHLNSGFAGRMAVTTRNDGTFSFRNVTPGQYVLEATRSGYIPELHGDRPEPRALPLQTLLPGQAMSGIRLVLTPGAVIAGRLTDERGEVVIGAVVQALKTTYKNGLRERTPVQTVNSDDLGEYRFFMLKPGEYFVNVLPPALVVATRPGQPATIPLFHPGTIDPNAATVINLRVGETLTGVDFTSIPLKNRQVTGGVQGNGSDPTGVILSPVNGTATRNITIDPKDPRFEFNDIVPGSYMLVARTYDMRAVVPLDVRNADVLGTRIILGPGFKIPVRARIEGHPPGDDPELENLYFIVRPEQPVPGLEAEVYSPFANGNFKIEVLKRDYRIDITRTEDHYVKSITLEGQDILNQGLRVTGSIDVPLEIVVDKRFGSVRGAAAANDVTVVLVPDAARRGQRALFRSARTSSGAFLFEKVPPGDYKLFAWAEATIENGGPWLEPEYLARFEDRATPVRIEADKPLNLDRRIPAF
jgi:hypothetical protein